MATTEDKELSELISKAIGEQLAQQLVPLRQDISSLTASSAAVEKRLAGVEGRLSDIENRVGEMEKDLGSVRRTVNAIESLPVPYGRPKSYFSATEFHSVSKPVRTRQGPYG